MTFSTSVSYDPGLPTPARRVNQHEGLYAVDSFRGEAKSYLVNLKTGTCSCPHWQQRLKGQQRAECKHLASVRAQVAAPPADRTPRREESAPRWSSVKLFGPRTEAEAWAELAAGRF